MAHLPVSGADIALRGADGFEDMLLQEAVGSPVQMGLGLLTHIAQEPSLDVALMCVTDFEYLLLRLRAARFGPQMTLAFACPHCGALAEVSFKLDDYLANIAPRAVPGVVADPERPDWFSFDGAGFRLPTAGDLAALAQQSQPSQCLAERCLDEKARQKPHRPRVERAMSIMAPELSRPIAGTCPSCGTAVQAGFSVARVVLTEMKRAAALVHDEVDLIARAYHWPEAQILSLPQDRRRGYAHRIRRAQPQGA